MDDAEVTSVVVGTAAGCDLRLPGPWLSPRHFEIYGEPGAVRVRDLGSTNGTMVRTRLYAPWQRATIPVPIEHGGMVVGGRVLVEIALDGRVTCMPSLSQDHLRDLFLGHLF